MKRTTLLMVAVIVSAMALKAQSHYLRIAVSPGIVTNSEYKEKFALGGSVAWMMEDHFIGKNPNNFISLTFKGMNNPFGEGKLISSILNDKSDAFNYLMPLAGYRFCKNGMDDGFFVEPRVGAAIGASGWVGFAFSPQCGYALNNFDFAAFCDMGLGSKQNVIRKKNFFTIGASVAYRIKL